jgi:hypothetical protein
MVAGCGGVMVAVTRGNGGGGRIERGSGQRHGEEKTERG